MGCWRRGDCVLTGERMPAQSAAIVNANQIHCLEFDCVHEGAVLHPMATILSAVFAGRTGKDRCVTISGRDLVHRACLGCRCLHHARHREPIHRSNSSVRPQPAGSVRRRRSSRLQLNERQLMDALGAQYAQTERHAAAPCRGLADARPSVGFNARASIVGTDLARADFADRMTFSRDVRLFCLVRETMTTRDWTPFWTSLDNAADRGTCSTSRSRGRLTHGVGRCARKADDKARLCAG